MRFSHCFLFLLLACILACAGCVDSAAPTKITLWHQMVVNERVVLDEMIDQFSRENPGIEVRALYKETEELRSGFQAAALAGTGPELVFGPSDSLGAFVTMEIVQDMRPWFDASRQAEFVDQALTFLASRENPDDPMLVQVGDRVGNHLALVYNRNLIKTPPKTTDEMVSLAVAATIDKNNDGRTDQYGLVWNFVEPFFAVPFLTGYGGWVFDKSGRPEPALDTPECVAALEFILSLQDKYKVLPANCDYETADALFKDGSAAMIINGDWSWGDYLSNKQIDAAIAPLPVVSATGLPLGPMVATKGYSLNVHATGKQADAAMKFVEFMTSEATERQFMTRLKTLPSRKSLLNDPLLTSDPTLLASSQQMKNGRPMPVDPELRAIWDSMRPHYQALLASNETAPEAARNMQRDAIAAIERMNQTYQSGSAGRILKFVAGLLTLGLLWWQRGAWKRLAVDWSRNRLAYLLIAPAMAVILFTIVYPFFYNVVLSFSNMSLRNFQDWQITGLQNYEQVLTEPKFFIVLLKTIIWTVVCVFFHVTIGLLLAVMLNGPVAGKSIYRVFLILPWAIPSYITALTWRGMFDYEYGAVNLIANQYLGLPVINWLGDPTNAFIACIVTNIWLGFPFMMVIALGGMQGIPGELYEAARMDRVSRLSQFWHITLPMLKPVLVPAITLGSIWTFNNLNVIWLVSNGGEPSDQTHILVSYVYKAVFNLYQYGYGAALSMAIFFLLLACSLLFLRRTNATEGVL
jgi:arabinogalactan oligomer/maltooligosaccharide transport system permease protein